MLMEYCGEGSDLTAFIKKQRDSELNGGGVLSESLIKKIMQELLEGLNHLHNKGICHRDIKPSNLYITDDHEHIKILDFNVAVYL